MKRVKHTLSNYRLSTFDMGQLIPTAITPILPGDSVQVHQTGMFRVSPMAAPVMHPVKIRVHNVFVSNRLITDKLNKDAKSDFEWEQFITGGEDGLYNTPIPQVTVPSDVANTLADHMGLGPTSQLSDISSLALAGLNYTWNELFRDQDLGTKRDLYDWSIPYISWEKDYFSTARPFSQKGPEVVLPIGNDAPVRGIGTATNATFPLVNQLAKETGETGNSTFASALRVSDDAATNGMWVEGDPNNSGFPGIYADLSQSTGANINDVRRAFAIQRYQEARARYGSRFAEYLRYLGITPSDGRLQRPELVSSSVSQMNFSEVMQTAQQDRTNGENYGVGDMYGHGVGGVRSRRARRFFEEHGYLYSFVSIRPKAMYYKGIPREFLKSTKEDYWQRELEQIGQQEVWNGEIYASPNTSQNTGTWAYSDRYDEYRRGYSTVSGEFRDILDYWHLGRDLPPATALNEDFIKCVPSKRVLNVQTNHAIWAMVNNHIVARRMVRKNATSRVL